MLNEDQIQEKKYIFLLVCLFKGLVFQFLYFSLFDLHISVFSVPSLVKNKKEIQYDFNNF